MPVHHLRITDGYRHAEAFEAGNISQFRVVLLGAMDSFVASQFGDIPAYQTRKLALAYRQRYHLHLRDPFCGDWWHVQKLSMIPYCDRRSLFRDGGATMWAAVEFTHHHAEEMAKFFGRHPSGENRLGAFLSEQLAPRLDLIDGGKPMAKRATVYFGQPLEALTSDLKDSESVSGRINRTAERYLAILERHGLDLTEAERNILGNCLSGSWAEPLLIRHLAHEVEDSEFFEERDSAAITLAEKLRGASFADLVATVERLGF